MADVARGKALLLKEEGLLVFAQAREETREWAICHIPVEVAGGKIWTWGKPWSVTVDGEQAHVRPSVLDLTKRFNPDWHNSYDWSVEVVEPKADEVFEGGFVGACKVMNEHLFAGWAYLE